MPLFNPPQMMGALNYFFGACVIKLALLKRDRKIKKWKNWSDFNKKTVLCAGNKLIIK
jgi:hypothetical protein